VYQSKLKNAAENDFLVVEELKKKTHGADSVM